MNKTNVSQPAAKSGGRKIRNDIILIAALLLVVCLAATVLFVFRTAGDTVVVTVDGRDFGEYSLNENREVEIRDRGYNLLVIKDGKAFVSRASCPDGICSSHRPIGYNGESIICLPNKVVVEIRTKDRNQPDIIA